MVQPPQIDGAVAECMCANGIKTLAISETQKFGHVTFFWNGNQSEKVDAQLEDYVEIPSDTVPFNEQPAMQAKAITDYVCEHMSKYDFIRINYPNGDMVGHTGVLSAVIESMEAVDAAIAQLIQAVEAINGILVVLADHGNADDMSKTAHTLNPVPFVVVGVDGQYELCDIDDAGLSNVAATLCCLLGIDVPSHFDAALVQRQS